MKPAPLPFKGKSDRPIGVVIPGFGHPQFLNETLQDVLTQTTVDRLVIVIVDDGCPYAETAAVPRHAMAALDIPLYYIRQPNKKLPAARNAGVRFLLNAHPELEAIFFLDADNRLAPFALESYEKALFAADHIGWSYPDIAFFGLAHNPLGFEVRETAPEYYLLKHLMGNISEAGSLVRAEIFREGHFFDEEMRDGFEDWDFWLTLAESGWRGARARHSGFFYRRRPESMLSDSRRKEEGLINRLRQKHPALFALTSVQELTHDEAPAFILIDEGARKIWLTSDPMRKGQEIDPDAFKDYCRKWRSSPREYFAPQMVIAGSDLFWLDDNPTPHLRFSFWSLAETIAQAGPRVLHIKDGSQHVLQVREAASGVGTRNLIAAPFDDFVTLLTQEPASRWKQIHMLCPGFQWPRQTGFTRDADAIATGSWIERLINLLAIEKEDKSKLGYLDRRYAGPDARQLYDVLLNDLMGTEDRLMYPYLAGDRITAFVAADVSALQNQAQLASLRDFLRWLGANDIAVRLGVEIGFQEDFPDGVIAPVQDLIDDCAPLFRQQLVAEHRTYLGRRLKQDFSLRDKEQAILLAQTADVMIAMGPCAVQSLFGELKAFGIKSFVFGDPPFITESTIESDDFGRLLAYEHAEAGIVLRNDHVRAALGAEGVPPGKLFDPYRMMEMIQKKGEAALADRKTIRANSRAKTKATM